MFDSIGRRGKVKNLSPLRWLFSSIIAGLIISGAIGTYDVVQSGPQAEAQVEEELEEVTFKQSLPPPPPPPPPPPARRPPRSTTRPKRNVITKKVIKKEIEDPEPTPIPKKEEDEPTPTPDPDELFDEFDGAEGGVPGGVLDGVIGGVVGSDTYGSSNIQEVDVNSIQKLKVVPPVYPPLAKRAGVEGQVLVEVTCSADGRVTNIKWLRGDVIFKEAVETALRQWRFAPRPISFKFQQPFNFKIKK